MDRQGRATDTGHATLTSRWCLWGSCPLRSPKRTGINLPTSIGSEDHSPGAHTRPSAQGSQCPGLWPPLTPRLAQGLHQLGGGSCLEP